MHLVLGHPQDACCAGVLARLEARGLPARLIATPLEAPARFAWRLDGDGLMTRLALDDGPSINIDSVLVRSTGCIDPGGWEPADHVYMQSEFQATLLAWLAGLHCPVVNRSSAALWYRPLNPLLVWQPLLRRCGLLAPEIVVTDDPDTAYAFGGRLEAAGVPGAVCTSLTRDVAWLIGRSDWNGLAAAQVRTPVCLIEPHGPTRPACIVGREVIWDSPPSPQEASLEPGLLSLATEAGLDFLEVATASIRRGLALVLVEPLPRLDHFNPAAREKILDKLTDLLTPSHRVQEARP
jgi:hypothetical protein